MMKQVRFLTILLMAFQMAGAQSYHPMLKDGKRWQCYYTNGLYELNFNYYLDGDTVIDGEKGLRLFCERINQVTGKVFTPYGRMGAMIEKDGRVYMIVQGKKELLFDFNLKVGDTAYGDAQWKVVDVRNIYVMGTMRKCLTLKYAGQDELYWGKSVRYWVEGVGSSHGLEPRAFLPLVSCYEGERCIFTAKNFEGMPEAAVDVEKHRPLLDEGKEWWYKDSRGFECDRREDFRMFVKGDTIIGGKTWKKIYNDNTIGSLPVYEKAMREEGGKVYELRQGGEESLLFDFSLNIGDRYIPAGTDGRYMEVIAKDTVISADIAHRRLVLMQHVNGVETDLTCWVEGIGGDCGIDLPAFWSDMDSKVIGGTDHYQYFFTGCLKQDGTCLYGEKPSIQTAVTAIRKPTTISPYYNLQGHHIEGQPRKGIYIRDGRKYLKR